MNSSQTSGFAVLVGVLAYPTIVALLGALRRWKDSRTLRKMANRR